MPVAGLPLKKAGITYLYLYIDFSGRTEEK